MTQQRQPMPPWFWVLIFIQPVIALYKSSWDLSRWTIWSWTLLVAYVLLMAFAAVKFRHSLRARKND